MRGHTSIAVSSSRGFWGDMAGLTWLDDGGKEEVEEVVLVVEEEEEGMEVEEEGWWLCWIRSGRWCMRPAKPFFSGWAWPGAGPAKEEEALANRFNSPALWK